MKTIVSGITYSTTGHTWVDLRYRFYEGGQFGEGLSFDSIFWCCQPDDVAAWPQNWQCKPPAMHARPRAGPSCFPILDVGHGDYAAAWTLPQSQMPPPTGPKNFAGATAPTGIAAGLLPKLPQVPGGFDSILPENPQRSRRDRNYNPLLEVPPHLRALVNAITRAPQLYLSPECALRPPTRSALARAPSHLGTLVMAITMLPGRFLRSQNCRSTPNFPETLRVQQPGIAALNLPGSFTHLPIRSAASRKFQPRTPVRARQVPPHSQVPVNAITRPPRLSPCPEFAVQPPARSPLERMPSHSQTLVSVITVLPGTFLGS